MLKELRLTTTDNPYDPFTQFELWDSWDVQAGYHTTSYLARVIETSDELSEELQLEAYNDAVLAIADYNLSGVHEVRVQPDDWSD